jgi:cellulose synthase/poly-beta-1,6-N-acetylglucosamine synthase-like glycosyltransferase
VEKVTDKSALLEEEATSVKIKSISVVIPAFNEARRIGPTIKKIVAYLKETSGKYEIIVVNEGRHGLCHFQNNFFCGGQYELIYME